MFPLRHLLKKQYACRQWTGEKNQTFKFCRALKDKLRTGTLASASICGKCKTRRERKMREGKQEKLHSHFRICCRRCKVYPLASKKEPEIKPLHIRDSLCPD
ncbi:Hypothetical predicted protein [Podarcis lilfordi]|nr:Hypothetical predicted protein [Podarcis lilfordi]